MQQEEIIITNPDAIRALRDTNLLAYFLEPQSPSEVARQVGQPANLVHHHVKRSLELGLLFEQRREGRRVYYQLTAKAFKFKRSLLSVDEDEGLRVRALASAFADAFSRSDRIAGNHDQDFTTHGFERESNVLGGDARDSGFAPSDPHPAHLAIRTLKLRRETYLSLVREVTRLMLEAEREDGTDAGACTLAVLAFDGVTERSLEGMQTVSSFAL